MKPQRIWWEKRSCKTIAVKSRERFCLNKTHYVTKLHTPCFQNSTWRSVFYSSSLSFQLFSKSFQNLVTDMYCSALRWLVVNTNNGTPTCSVYSASHILPSLLYRYHMKSMFGWKLHCQNDFIFSIVYSWTRHGIHGLLHLEALSNHMPTPLHFYPLFLFVFCTVAL